MKSIEIVNPINVREHGSLVIVEFDNGINARFTPYRHGFGYQIEGLCTFELLQNEEILFRYNSRLYRCGPQDDEHCVSEMKEGMTQEMAAEYWKKARNFVVSKFYPNGREGENYKITDTSYWYPWRVVVSEGYYDLERLTQGKCKILKGK